MTPTHPAEVYDNVGSLQKLKQRNQIAAAILLDSVTFIAKKNAFLTDLKVLNFKEVVLFLCRVKGKAMNFCLWFA